MDERAAAERWARVERLFDEALTLPPPLRAELLARHARNDDRLVQDVQALLDQIQTRGDLLDRAAAQNIVGKLAAPSLAMGTRVGPWRVLGFVGRGGMGEVYQAERCDGQFQQAAALKFIRREAVDQLDRFHEERRLLARLDHPGIARLIDGGLSEDGRPWMAMEWVEGVSITDWCRDHEAGLRQRLGVFLQVCEAVAYAHRNLLVHRDLKPGNVLVSAEGRSKLLDFGVAKLLTSGADETRTQAPITLAYAAPEQLAQGPITPATDVYALGLLLFEMLTGQRPWHRPEMSLPMLIDRQLRDPAPAPSASAARLHAAPIPPRQIRGDLDAITGCALRPEPERRYRSAAELVDDVYRYLDAQPVVARPESFAYLLHRFVRRNPLATAFAGVAILALVAGLAASLWQAREAQRAAQAAAREAARATATRDFLIGVFRASDPRIAQDKPRGQVTAKELLDLSAPKIGNEFKDDPETQIELLSVAAAIYREMGEEGRYRALHGQRMALTRRYGGELHPLFIQGLLEDAAWEVGGRRDFVAAGSLLAQADPLIREAGLDQTETRALWWTLSGRTRSSLARISDLRQAVDLFRQLGTVTAESAHVLFELGSTYLEIDPPEPARAEEYMVAALDHADRSGNPDDLVASIGNGLAMAREAQDDFEGALRAYAKAMEYSARARGEGHFYYWVIAANFGDLLFLQGRREEAHDLFDRLMPEIPAKWALNSNGDYVREMYAKGLTGEGRPALAIPLLEGAAEAYRKFPESHQHDLDRVEWQLALAYAGAGRKDEARKFIRRAIERASSESGFESARALTRLEHWGRFLLDEGDVDAAEAQFREVLTHAAGRTIQPVALAIGGNARIALIRNEPRQALASSEAAIGIFNQVTGARDVRSGPYLWLIRSDALRRSGDRAGARQAAERALEASRRYDHPEAASIRQATMAVAASSWP